MKNAVLIALGLMLLIQATLSHAQERRLLRCNIDENGLARVTVIQSGHGFEVNELYDDGKEIRLPVSEEDIDNGRIMLSPLKDKYRKLTRGSKGWAMITGSIMNWTNLKCVDNL